MLLMECIYIHVHGSELQIQTCCRLSVSASVFSPLWQKRGERDRGVDHIHVWYMLYSTHLPTSSRPCCRMRWILFIVFDMSDIQVNREEGYRKKVMQLVVGVLGLTISYNTQIVFPANELLLSRIWLASWGSMHKLGMGSGVRTAVSWGNFCRPPTQACKYLLASF